MGMENFNTNINSADLFNKVEGASDFAIVDDTETVAETETSQVETPTETLAPTETETDTLAQTPKPTMASDVAVVEDKRVAEPNRAKDLTGQQEVSKENYTDEKKELINLIESNPEFNEARGKLTQAIEVVKVLRAKRVAGAAPKDCGRIVAYTVCNRSNANVDLSVLRYTENEEGIYVGKRGTVTLAPTQTIDLTRRDMGVNFNSPTYGSLIANGRINTDIQGVSMAEALDGTKFSFSKDSGLSLSDSKLVVWVDEVDKASKEYVLKADYRSLLGELANKPQSTVALGGKRNAISDKEAQAYLIFKKVKEAGLIPDIL